MAVASRRRLARVVADGLRDGQPHAHLVRQLAAYLIANKQLAQVELYLGDIEAELARDGMTIADVTTARPLDDQGRVLARDYVQKTTGASEVVLREHVDSAIVGGIIIRTSGHEMDASVAAQIRQLKTA